MSHMKPEFHLQRVNADGSTGAPEVYSIHNLPTGFHTSRRGFLGAGMSVATLLALITGGGKRQTYANAIESFSENEGNADPAFQSAAEQDRNGEPAAAVDAAKISAVQGDSPNPPQVTPVYAHSQAVRALAVSPDGRLLASGGNDSEIKLWSLPDGKLLKTLKEHGGFTVALAFTKSGQSLISGAHDQSVKVWELPEVRLKATFNTDNWGVSAVSVSPDDRLLAAAESKGTIIVWNLETGQKLASMASGGEDVESLAFAKHGVLAAAYQGGTVKQWWSDGSQHHSTVLSERGGKIAVNRDRSVLASIGPQRDRVTTWFLSGTGFLSEPQGRAVRTFVGYPDAGVEALVLTHDDRILAFAADEHVLLWSLMDGQHLNTLVGHTRRISSLAVTPDSKVLVSADWDGTIILWDLASGKQIGYLFDPAASKTDAFVYHVTDTITGQTLTYTLPCGSPIPVGATCICNCVPGTYRSTPVTSSQSFCTCNKVCVCIPVCQAHRLLHPDPAVRTMAEQLLLVMGARELAYMQWAANSADKQLRKRICDVINAITNDARPDPNCWPTMFACMHRLDDADEVVAIMAAQMIRLIALTSGTQVDSRISHQVDQLICRAAEKPWYVRADNFQQGRPDITE
jgi:WD40 repeat protein